MEVKVWVLGGIVTALVIIVSFMGRASFRVIKELLISMLDELKKLTGLTREHEIRIKNLEKSRDDHENRLRDLNG